MSYLPSLWVPFCLYPCVDISLSPVILKLGSLDLQIKRPQEIDAIRKKKNGIKYKIFVSFCPCQRTGFGTAGCLAGKGKGKVSHCKWFIEFN